MPLVVPSRRRFLLSSAALIGVPGVTLSRRAHGAPGEAKNLIVVLAVGGWDVTFCFDPKLSCGSGCFIEGPEVDETNHPDDVETVQTFGGIPAVVNPHKRPAVGDFFDRWGSRSHVVNGVWTGSIAHDPCRYRILTGTPDGTKPDLATITGYEHGGERPLGSVDLSGWSISGQLSATSGRVGHNSQIKALLDRDTRFRAPASVPWTYPLFEPEAADEQAIQAFLAERTRALQARFEGRDGASAQRVADLVESRDRARRFQAQGSGILDLLKVGEESGFYDQLSMAVDLIDQEVCRAVTIDTTYDWDTHDVNLDQHLHYQRLFTGLDQLMGRLEELGHLDDTVVVVLSEMTRTPLRNAVGGKDHWGHTSALMLGAVRGNAVSGGTDDYLESLPVDLATGAIDGSGELNKYDNLCAGMLELVGVDPEPWLPGVTPFRGAHPS